MRETFVIVEEQSLVQLDLAEQLREIAPDSDVLAYRTVANALPGLSKMKSLTGAIYCAHPGELPAPEFVDHVERLNAWLVCTTDLKNSEIVAAGWHQMTVPFSNDRVMTLFSTLLDRPAG